MPPAGRRVRALHRHLGAVHDRGRRQARHLELRLRRSRSRASTRAPGSRWCATRTTTRRRTTPSSARATPDRFEITVNTNLDNIFDQIERGELETSFETPPNAVVRRYLQDPEIRERLRVNARRPHLVRLHEPDDATVRRRPRAQGDEPRDGPRGHPARLGRAGRWAPSRPTCSRTRCWTSPTTSRTSRPPWRATSRPPRPRWPSRSTTPTRTAPATPRPARA